MRKWVKGSVRKLFCVIKVTGLVLLLAGAADAEEKAGSSGMDELPRVSMEEYPAIDGSLACVPLMEALAKRVTGCSDSQAEALAGKWFTNTNPCYIHLAEGERDLLLAYEPADSTKEELLAYDPLEMEPVGKDALVFIVNRDNPVDELSLEQARDIFTGKITNWSQLGGMDQPIMVFTRPETSGSQTLMRKLLIGDLEMVDYQTEEIPGMEGMLQAIRDYDNSANAIGYSVYFYASSMYDLPDLKFLKVDGAEPSNETIRSGEYSLVNEFYCVTSGQSSGTAVRIRDWLLSVEGQKFVEDCGYVPAKF